MTVDETGRHFRLVVPTLAIDEKILYQWRRVRRASLGRTYDSRMDIPQGLGVEALLTCR